MRGCYKKLLIRWKLFKELVEKIRGIGNMVKNCLCPASLSIFMHSPHSRLPCPAFHAEPKCLPSFASPCPSPPHVNPYAYPYAQTYSAEHLHIHPNVHLNAQSPWPGLHSHPQAQSSMRVCMWMGMRLGRGAGHVDGDTAGHGEEPGGWTWEWGLKLGFGLRMNM